MTSMKLMSVRQFLDKIQKAIDESEDSTLDTEMVFCLGEPQEENKLFPRSFFQARNNDTGEVVLGLALYSPKQIFDEAVRRMAEVKQKEKEEDAE